MGQALARSNWNDVADRDLRTNHSGEKVTWPGVESISLNAWFHGEDAARAKEGSPASPSEGWRDEATNAQERVAARADRPL
eukprot:8998026-Lingulodinium_polyedra.AAC.1